MPETNLTAELGSSTFTTGDEIVINFSDGVISTGGEINIKESKNGQLVEKFEVGSESMKGGLYSFNGILFDYEYNNIALFNDDFFPNLAKSNNGISVSERSNNAWANDLRLLWNLSIDGKLFTLSDNGWDFQADNDYSYHSTTPDYTPGVDNSGLSDFVLSPLGGIRQLTIKPSESFQANTSYEVDLSNAGLLSATGDLNAYLKFDTPLHFNFATTVEDNQDEKVPVQTSYSLSLATSSIDEGDSFTASIKTTNLDSGTKLYYAIKGDVDSSDFSSSIIRSVSIDDNGNASFTYNATKDLLTEGREWADIILYTDGQRTLQVAKDSLIIRDTSISSIDDIKEATWIELTMENRRKFNSISSDELFNIKEIDHGVFTVARTKKHLRKLMGSRADVIYFQNKGELYLNANLKDKGWGRSGKGGLLAKFKNKPKLDNSRFEGLISWPPDNVLVDGFRNTKRKRIYDIIKLANPTDGEEIWSYYYPVQLHSEFLENSTQPDSSVGIAGATNFILPLTEGNHTIVNNSGEKGIFFHPGEKGIFSHHETPKKASYSLSLATSSIDEGDSFTASIKTTNLDSGTKLYYAIKGDVDSSDFSSSLIGSVSIDDNGNASFTKKVAKDLLTEGNESADVALYTDRQRTLQVADTASLIIRDKSKDGSLFYHSKDRSLFAKVKDYMLFLATRRPWPEEDSLTGTYAVKYKSKGNKSSHKTSLQFDRKTRDYITNAFGGVLKGQKELTYKGNNENTPFGQATIKQGGRYSYLDGKNEFAKVETPSKYHSKFTSTSHSGTFAISCGNDEIYFFNEESSKWITATFANDIATCV